MPESSTRADARSVELEVMPAPTDASLDRLEADHAEYVRLCRRAAEIKVTMGFRDIQKMDVVRRAGRDKEGRPVFMFIPGNLERGVDLERVTMFCLTLMHDVVVAQDKPFACVWLCNNLWPSKLGFLFFRRTYNMVPRPYRKNMQWLRIVHPATHVRLLLFALSYYVKESFWEKFDYCDRIEFLDEVVPLAQLKLPQDYVDYDKLLEQEARQMSDPDNPGSIGGMMGGGMMGGGMMGGMGGMGSMGSMGGMGGLDGATGVSSGGLGAPFSSPAAGAAASQTPYPREDIWSEDEDEEEDEEEEDDDEEEDEEENDEEENDEEKEAGDQKNEEEDD